jgi:hypothetical protein
MRIHPKSLALAVRAWFFPIPSGAPEIDANVARFQHHKVRAPGFEAKPKDVTIEGNRSVKIRNLKQDVIDFRCGVYR